MKKYKYNKTYLLHLLLSLDTGMHQPLHGVHINMCPRIGDRPWKDPGHTQVSDIYQL